MFSAAASASALSDWQYLKSTISMPGYFLASASSKPLSRSIVEEDPGTFFTTAILPDRLRISASLSAAWTPAS